MRGSALTDGNWRYGGTRTMSQAMHNAMLMALFHKRFGTIPDYESILEATYRLFIASGQTVLDIGAHTGRHAAVFSELVGKDGKVHAFEPLPWAFEILANRGFARNVIMHNCAITEQSGSVPFIFAKGAPEESGLRVKRYNNPRNVVPETITVAARSLDSLDTEIGAIHFIKIDAEGSEISCIRGGSQVIAAHRPFMTVEYGYPSYSAYDHDAASLFDLAVSMGYVIGDLFGAYCADLATWSRVCDVAYWDWFLIPLERIDEWQAKIRLSC
jgi:FkbM family methyltransferase